MHSSATGNKWYATLVTGEVREVKAHSEMEVRAMMFYDFGHKQKHIKSVSRIDPKIPQLTYSSTNRGKHELALEVLHTHLQVLEQDARSYENVTGEWTGYADKCKAEVVQLKETITTLEGLK